LQITAEITVQCSKKKTENTKITTNETRERYNTT